VKTRQINDSENNISMLNFGHTHEINLSLNNRNNEKYKDQSFENQQNELFTGNNT